MVTWLARYQAGEHVAVWREMIALGTAIRPSVPVRPEGQLAWEDMLRESRDDRYFARYADALAVARETMRRARLNVELLVSRLRALDYQFETPEWVHVLPSSETPIELDAIERLSGPLPLSVRAWIEQVGMVCLYGEHPRITKFRSDWAFPRGLYPDPLEFMMPFSAVDLAYDAWYDRHSHGEEIPLCVPFSADEIMKANFSGGHPFEIALPDPSADTSILNAWCGEIGFLTYLRLSFKWGGFPGFSRYPDYPRSEIAFLTRDLLPL